MSGRNYVEEWKASVERVEYQRQLVARVHDECRGGVLALVVGDADALQPFGTIARFERSALAIVYAHEEMHRVNKLLLELKGEMQDAGYKFDDATMQIVGEP